MPLSRRYLENRLLHNKRLDGMWISDTMDEQKSLYGNIYAQVFSSGTLFAEIYTMDIKSDAGIALKKLITELGVPECLIIYGLK